MIIGLLLLLLQADASAIVQKIQSEKNLEAKKKLVLTLEKTHPDSNRLPEAYMDLSRAMVPQADYKGATQYAERAVAAVGKLKKEAAAAGDAASQSWLNSMDKAAKDNLAWVKQSAAWQDQNVRSRVLGKR
jgi:hypothetical protein